MPREVTFEVMGARARIVAFGRCGPSIESARSQLLDWHRRWTRFEHDSELNRLNQRGGRFTIVDRDTMALIQAAVRAWHRTGGRFDPTILDAVISEGYGACFEPTDPSPRATGPSARPAGCAEITVLQEASAVFLPAGVRLDLGGIAKGFSAQATAERLVEEGATGAAVEIGGDMVTRGRPPEGGWPVELAAIPLASRSLRVGEAAVCTSSRLRRRWATPAGERHHIIDPASGRSTRTTTTTVSVIAHEGVDAETCATAALTLEPHEAASWLRRQGVSGYVVDQAGRVLAAGHPERFAP